jgi:hypothetical protein
MARGVAVHEDSRCCEEVAARLRESTCAQLLSAPPGFGSDQHIKNSIIYAFVNMFIALRADSCPE